MHWRGLTARVRRFNFSSEKTGLWSKERSTSRLGTKGSPVSYILDERETSNASEEVEEHPPKAQPVKKVKIVEAEPHPDLADRVSELEEALTLEKTKSEDLLRRLQYLQADFENYRKRVEKEIGDVRRYGNERLLSDLLTVKDELELAYDKAKESNQNPVILDGVGMILKRMQTLLSKEGVERVPGVGCKFNPDYHEAALRVPSDEEEDTVVEEVRPGYLLKGKVLRASIVKVAEKKPLEESASEEETRE
jgi:molecular chaperone GrpE